MWCWIFLWDKNSENAPFWIISFFINPEDKKKNTLLLYIIADLKAADILPGVYKTHSEVFLIHGLLWLSSLYPVNGYASDFQKVDSTYINLIYNYFNHTERNQFWGYYAHKCIKFTINFYLMKLGEIQHGHCNPSLII